MELTGLAVRHAGKTIPMLSMQQALRKNVSHFKECHQICETHLNRDLLKRHGSVHDPLNEDSPKRQRRQDSARVAQACIACAENHVRCEEAKPCQRCLKKNIPCQSSSAMDDERLGNADAVSGLLQLSQEPRLPSNMNNTDIYQHLNIVDDSRTLHDVEMQGSDSNSQDLSSEYRQDATVRNTSPTDSRKDHWSFDQHTPNTLNPPHLETQADAVDELPGFLRGVLLAPPDFAYPPGTPGYMSGTWTPRGLLGFGFESNLELNDVDFSFLDNYNAHIPFDLETPRSDTLSSAVRPGDQATASRSEAFRTSVWRFIPRPQDHSAAEQQNLSLPEVAQGHDSPESRIRLDRRTTSEKLDQSCRDKIIAIVLSTCKPAMMFRSVSAFPSVELLDILLQFFLTSPLSGSDSWLHIPTFCSMTKDRTEVLLAAIASGAVLTPDNSLRKLGFALQEAIRAHLGFKVCSHMFSRLLMIK
jgi:hypothetical protein